MADHASGFCVYNDAALAIKALLRRGRPAGRLRRRRRPPRRRRAGRVLRRPAGADRVDPRDAAVAVPGHRLARPNAGAGAAHGTAVNIALPAGTSDAAWLRAFHAVVPGVVHGVPAGGAGHPARRRLPPGGPAGRPEPDRRRAADVLPGAAGPGRDGHRRPLAGPRRRRVRPGPGGAAGLDPPAGHRRRPGRRPGDPAAARTGSRWPPAARPGRRRCRST